MARGSPSRPPVRTRFGGIKFDVARSEVPAAARTPIQAAPPPRPKAEPKAAAKQARCPANSFPAIASRCRSRCGADRCATAAQEGKPRPKSQSIAASFAAKPSGSRCGPCSLARSSPDPGLERSRLNRRVTSAARHAQRRGQQAQACRPGAGNGGQDEEKGPDGPRELLQGGCSGTQEGVHTLSPASAGCASTAAVFLSSGAPLRGVALADVLC